MTTHALSTVRWGYSLDEDAERWLGACATREEAIQEGRRELAREMDVRDPGFWIASGAIPDPGAWCPEVTDFIEENIGDNAYSDAGEASEDWPPVVSKEARAELETFCVAWVRKHMPVEFWISDGTKEWIDLSVHRVGGAAEAPALVCLRCGFQRTWAPGQSWEEAQARPCPCEGTSPPIGTER